MFPSTSFNRVVSTLALSIILSACGGGGGGAAADSASTAMAMPSQSFTGSADEFASGETADANPPVDNPADAPSIEQAARNNPGKPLQALVIDYYGDSTIWGYESGTGAQVGTPAPAAFAAALANPSRYTVRNEGVNSSDACQLLNGADGRHQAWDTQMANSNANVVIINHAINDQWRMDVNRYKACLTSLASKAKAHGKKVVFETPNPTRDAGPDSLGIYVNAMKAVAAQEGAPVIDQYSHLLSYLNGRSVYTIVPDGLHPTAEAYIMKGKYAAMEFAKLAY